MRQNSWRDRHHSPDQPKRHLQIWKSLAPPQKQCVRVGDDPNAEQLADSRDCNSY